MMLRLLRARESQTVPTNINSHIGLQAVARAEAVVVHRRQNPKSTGQMATRRNRAR
jgi:hypothetical protein